MAKKLKLPALSDKTKILSFDLETNGLHGKAFAIGAVVMDAGGKIHDQFSGRTEIKGEVDEWVKLNVLPAIEDLPINYKNYEQMRETFWQWYKKTEPNIDYVLVNNGYPVEYRFLLDCQEADLEKRYWDHPFPILDLTSLLLQVGEKQPTNRNNSKLHHPLHDATTAAQAAFKAFRRSGQIN